MRKFLAVLALVSSSAVVMWAADMTPKQEAQDRLERAGAVLQEVTGAPDKGIPDEVLSGAKCIAVVPKLIKAGFVFGGQHGRGVATCRLASGGWSAPAFFTVSGGSWGAQIGVEGVDLVMMIMNNQGMQHLMSNKFQVGGEASASAGPVGRHASADTDWKAGTEMLTYSRSKGLFAGISLNGTWVTRDADAIAAMYGPNIPTDRILNGGVSAPAGPDPFLAEVRTLENRANAEKTNPK
jgi:lipid-binding SYLF domain-containing protein